MVISLTRYKHYYDTQYYAATPLLQIASHAGHTIQAHVTHFIHNTVHSAATPRLRHSCVTKASAGYATDTTARYATIYATHTRHYLYY